MLCMKMKMLIAAGLLLLGGAGWLLAPPLRHAAAEEAKSAADTLDNLAALAENIQQVAIEARSLTEAKQELASALGEGQGGKAEAILERPQFQELSGH